MRIDQFKALGIACIAAISLASGIDFHLTSDFSGVINDDAVMAARVFAQRMYDKLVQVQKS